MWRNLREKHEDFETESEEEIDIVEEVAMILDVLEELEAESRLEKKLRVKLKNDDIEVKMEWKKKIMRERKK